MQFFKKKKRQLLIEGVVGEKLPEGFKHPVQIPEYLLSNPDLPNTKFDIVGDKECHGIAWTIFGMNFESYTSDIEPKIIPGKWRMVMWQRISRTDIPKGWHRLYIGLKSSQMGFAEIKDKENYWKSWAGDARRNRTRFLHDDRFVFQEVSFEKYKKAYESMKGFEKFRPLLIQRMERKRKYFDDIDYVLAVEKNSGKIFAGLATINLPKISQSDHHNAFLDHEAPHSSVGTGIVDYWFQRCIQKNIKFLNFGVFWSKGEPRSWKGFSRFKAQFITHMINFPRILFKITKG